MVQTRKYQPTTPKQAAALPGRIDAELDASLFKALSDPTRLSLVACIAKCGRGCSVSEVAECTSVDLSVVSRHLALLAQSGVLEATKEGRTVRYRVRYTELTAALRGLADAVEECCPDCGDGCRPASSAAQQVEHDGVTERGAPLISTITCPHCAARTEAVVPEGACQFFWACPECGAVVRPKAGDCCVFCSYGDHRCPTATLPSRDV